MTTIVGTKPKRLLLSVAVIAGVAAPAILPSAATAATFPRATSASAAAAVPDSGGGDGCNPERANNSSYYWIGATSQNTIDGTPPGGLYANIRTYSPFVAGPNQGASSTDSVSEWVMLDSGDPQSTQWAQIGWLEFPYGVRNTFIQYADGSNNLHTDYFAPSAINSTQTYGVLYQPGAEYPFTISENGSNLVSFSVSWAPTSADIFAELHTQASQVPGGTADPSGQVAQVTNAHVWPTAGSGGWGNFNGYTLYTSLPSGPMGFIGIAPNGVGGQNSWRTWDKACKL